MKRRRVGQDEAELVSQLEATHKLVDAATTGGLYAPLPPNMSTDLGAPPPHSSYVRAPNETFGHRDDRKKKKQHMFTK